MLFTKYLLPVLYAFGLYSAYLAGFLYLQTQSTAHPSASKPVAFRFPRTTLTLLLIIAIPSTLQFFFPVLLPLFQRDTTRFMSGEWWRIITPIFFQDGGISGTIFNLVTLGFVGFVAEQYWDNRKMLIVFFAGGIVAELVGLAWQPIGAGNSGANFGLAGSLVMLCLVRRAPRVVQVAALLALGADIILVSLQNVHGPAALAGAVLALVLSRSSKREQEP